MSDPTPPASGSAPAGGKPAFDAAHLAEEGKKVAAKAWEWTKKATAFAWPKLKHGAKVVSEKVDAEMDKIIESVNHPAHHDPSAPSQAPTTPDVERPSTPANTHQFPDQTNQPQPSNDRENSIPPR